MAGKPHTNGVYPDSVEARLSRVEDQADVLAVQTAELALKFEHVSEQIEASHRQLSEQLSDGFSDVKKRLETVETRLGAVEQSTAPVIKTYGLGAKVVIGGIAIAGGVLVTKLAELLWGLL